jgi:hypothetical protein
MRPQVTGYQFWVDADSIAGDGTPWNVLRVATIVAPGNPTIAPGVPASPGVVFVDTGATPPLAYVFTGPALTDWVPIGSAASSVGYSFAYVATGAEDPSGFPVVFPVARPDANYVVTATCGDVAALLLLATKTYTATQFICKASAALTVGDVINFTVGTL